MRIKRQPDLVFPLASAREKRRERIREEKERIRKKGGGRAAKMRSATWAFRLHILALAGFLFGLGCGEKAPFMQWRPFTNSEFGFTAEFPNDPVYNKSYLDTQDGRVYVHQFQHKSIAFVYYVSVTQFPHQLMAQQPKRQTLQILMEDQIQGMRGARVHSSIGSFDGYPALRFRARLPQDGANLRNENYLTSEIIIKGDTVYRISAIGMGNEEEITRFLSSFKFL